MNEVEAAKTEHQRQQIESHLRDYGQIYLDVWKLGINTFLRISDVLALTIKDIQQIDLDEPTLKLTERKTQNSRTITLNNTALGILQRRLKDHSNEVWLFQSPLARNRRAQPKPYSRQQIGRTFADVGQQIRPKISLGTHSMRKTRGYAMHRDGRPIEEICRALNHSHPAVTMRYIGLTQEEINQTFTDYEL